MNKYTILLLFIMATPAIASIHLSPSIGYSYGGKLENEEGEKLEFEPSENFALSVMTDFDKGRIGLFYAEQHTDIENQNLDLTLRHLHFQSAIYYAATEHLSPFIGLSLGGTQLDSNWASTEYEFSSSVYGGFEYIVSPSIALQAQLRWIGTLTDSKSYTVCTLPEGDSEQCFIRYESDWLGQVQTNIGLVFKW